MDVFNWIFSLFALDWLIRFGLSLRVLMRRVPVSVTFAWITIILVVPIAGALLYLMFGETRLGVRRASRVRAIAGPFLESARRLAEQSGVGAEHADSRWTQIAREVQVVHGYPPLRGNRVDIYESSIDALKAIRDDIDTAESFCHLEFYIWWDGGLADDVAAALVRARERGVAVRVGVDGAGSSRFLRGHTAESLRRAGVELVEQLPISLLRVPFQRIDVRNHRKIAVIDNRVGYTGSLNIADPRVFKKKRGLGEWVDAMARIEGPAVGALNACLLESWELDTGRRETEALESPVTLDAGEAIAQVMPSGPSEAPRRSPGIFLSLLYEAREEIVLTTPYFAPDDTTADALRSAVHRGVDVTLIVPRRVDSVLTRYACRSRYEELLESGVRILEFSGGLLHAKTITVDRQVALVGSVNIDMRSLWLNFEITLMVYNEAVAKRLRETQQRYEDGSAPVSLEAWRRRSFWERFAENAAQLASPLL